MFLVKYNHIYIYTNLKRDKKMEIKKPDDAKLIMK